VDSSSRDQKYFICREEKRKAARGMQRDLEIGGSLGKVGNWVLESVFYCPRVEISLWCKEMFPGKE
jgi:hypothetical protein